MAEEKDTTKQSALEDRKVAFFTALEIIKTKKHFFYLTIFLTVFGTLIGHYLKVPTFETTSSLFIQNIEQPSAAEYLFNQNVLRLSRHDRMESYINHLKSDSFYLRVAEKLKFHQEFEKLNLVAPKKKSKLELNYWRKKFFTVEQERPFERKLLTPIENIVLFLKSTVKYHTDYNSQFIQVHTRTMDARTSQLIANLIADEFVEITNRHSIEEIKQVEDFVASKMSQTQDKVKELDKKLIRFKQRHNIVSADESTRNLAARLSNLEAKIESAKIQMDENNKLISFFKTASAESISKMLQDGSTNPTQANAEALSILQEKIDQMKKQKSAFIAQGYSSNSWQVEKLNQEIESSLGRLKSLVSQGSQVKSINPRKAEKRIQELNDSNQVLDSKIATLRKARTDLQRQVDMMPSLQQEYIRLENNFKREVENLANLERKEKELEIQRISHKKEVRVDQLAPLPGATPRGSLLFKLLFSCMAAIFLGILIVIGLETLDPSIKKRQDLYDCGVEFFGEIPLFNGAGKRKTPNKKNLTFGSPEDIVTVNAPESIESMAFKYLRARIESMRYKNGKECQMIAVSSALHNEGKSYITANLAASLAQLKRKTILIDADLRRPSQTAYFGLSSQFGLVDLLNMKKDLSDVLKKDIHPNLDILPAGYCGTDSTELISSQKFKILLDYLRNEYEYVIVDTPPTFAVVDAAIVASFSDIPILISSFRETRKADLHEAYNDLLQVSYKKVYGIINKATVSNSRIHYYGYPLYHDSKSANVANMTPESPDDDTQDFLNRLNQKSS